MVNRIITGAHYGLKHWLYQRITAVVMALYSVLMVVFWLTHRPLSYADWHGFMHNGAMRLFSLLFLLSLSAHAWVGVRNIFMDYVKPNGVRLALHSLMSLALIVYIAWGVQILWSN